VQGDPRAVVNCSPPFRNTDVGATLQAKPICLTFRLVCAEHAKRFTKLGPNLDTSYDTEPGWGKIVRCHRTNKHVILTYSVSTRMLEVHCCKERCAILAPWSPINYVFD
jgi:hypothetical protein